MTLTVSFVDELHGIVEPVQQYLQRDLHQRDLFASQVVVVPTIGVRSWLTPLLATSLGATDGRNDGIFANVNVQYVGYLQRMLRQAAGLASDPWERNRVNLATLQALDGFPETARLEKKYNGRLNAARILAERFDRYATRRPELIRSWHRGVAALGDLSVEKYHWQFELWQRVRDIVGAAPWPVLNAEMCAKLRAGETIPGIPDRLMIAGFETISPSNIEIIDALSTVIDVEMIFVHQSPHLRAKWNEMASSVVPNKAELPVPTNFSPLSASSLRLPPSWMQSSFDLELLLAAYGIRGEYLVKASSGSDVTLLKALQQGIAHAPVETVASQSADLSVQIHRAHNLSRQVEVLHDALLHAFQDDKHLQPHDVVVLCADIQNAAPILEAVFDKTVKTSAGRSIRLPLVVADRTLKDISDGADLASNLLNLMTSRFDLESFMLVATSPLVMKNFGVGESDISVWTRHVERTRLRWGLDAEHREVHGLVAPKLNAHGWLEVLERSLLGALMSIGADSQVMAGDLRPAVFVESSDTHAISSLVGLMSVLAKFEHSARTRRSVGDWCTKTEEMLSELCGQSCSDLDDVLTVLNVFQRASASLTETVTSGTHIVAFAEFAEYVMGELTASSGRLPLRSGSITATSFVPLRTVPFKVVCIVGFDDGTLPMGEPEGDDLIAATPMLGDGDPKIEARRVFLDALMSAEQRFIVTCTGRNIKNNKSVPLITPLNEFLDFCRECGVDVPEDADKLSLIEYSHPRHLGSPENFRLSGGPVNGKVWSHDTAGLLVAAERQRALTSSDSDEPEVSEAVTVGAIKAEIPLTELESLVYDPLGYYMRVGLGVYREWDSDDVSSVLPLSVEGYEYKKICQDLFLGNIADTDVPTRLEIADVLPVSPLSELAKKATVSLVKKYRAEYQAVLSSDPEVVTIALTLDNRCKVTGSVERYHRAEGALAVVSFGERYEFDYARLAIQALALIASGIKVQKAFLFHLNDGGTSTTKRLLEIDSAITPDIAQQKLSGLVAIEPIARTSACPLFGGAAKILYSAGIADEVARREKSESRFDSFVGTSQIYSRSNELIIYGANPEFRDVYVRSSKATEEFLSNYFSYFNLSKIDNSTPQTWRLSK